MKELQEQLLIKAHSLPIEAGCYLMKEKNGRVIYVGKAKNLKARVSSYFNQSAKNVKTQFLVSHISDFEFFVTQSEVESFILENNLIKKHSPKYNIRLRDDKSYPYVQINTNEPYPRLEFVRRPKKEKGKYLFGPFPVGMNISPILRILSKTYGLRDCSLSEFKRRKNPCLLFQMNQCSAPCVGKINDEEYHQRLKKIQNFFKNTVIEDEVINDVKTLMENSSDKEEFERAALYRDQMDILKTFKEESNRQNVESLVDEKNVDIWSYFQGEEEWDISLYMVRRGALVGQKNFHFLNSHLVESLNEELQSFLIQYYGKTEESSPELIILNSEERNESWDEAIKELLEVPKLKISGPSKKYKSLVEMTYKHAQECQRVRIMGGGSHFDGLKKLKELLELKELPRHLECYDIAIWQGQSPAASQVVSVDGQLDKSLYRYYNLEVRPEGNNDFAMMKEVITRRLKHGELPDVFVVDGGVAQVNTFLAVFREHQVSIPVVGIAKARQLKESKTEERLIIPGRVNPYILSKCPPLMRIIVTLRDEAHRFSRKLHHKNEKDRTLKTWIDDVEGIGPVTAQKILKKLDLPLNQLKIMTEDELQKQFEITKHEAHLLKKHFDEQDEQD